MGIPDKNKWGILDTLQSGSGRRLFGKLFYQNYNKF